MTPSSLLNYLHLIFQCYIVDMALQKWRTRRLGPLESVGGPVAGKVALVTGGTSGIGKATAVELGRRGAAVILPCRDPIRGEKAAEEIRAAQRSSGHEVDVKVVEMDLSDLSSVEACVKNVTELDCPLHLLINNGGIYDLGGSRKQTKEGFELHMATNHLSHFSLTLRLLPLLQKSAANSTGGARVVNVSSHMHMLSHLRANNMHLEKSFDFQTAYANSVEIFAVHPGVVRTSITRSLPSLLQTAQDIIKSFRFTPEEGARSVIYCCTSHEAALEATKSFGYFSSDCTPFLPGSQARSDTLSSFLWRFSVHATDIPSDLDIAQV